MVLLICIQVGTLQQKSSKNVVCIAIIIVECGRKRLLTVQSRSRQQFQVPRFSLRCWRTCICFCIRTVLFSPFHYEMFLRSIVYGASLGMHQLYVENWQLSEVGLFILQNSFILVDFQLYICTIQFAIMVIWYLLRCDIMFSV